MVLTGSGRQRAFDWSPIKHHGFWQFVYPYMAIQVLDLSNNLKVPVPLITTTKSF